MKIRKEVETIKREIEIYVADDGTEFYSSVKCMKYEAELKRKKLLEAAKSLEIEDLENVLPINTDGLPNENNYFTWYKIKDAEDFEIVNNLYNLYNNSLQTLQTLDSYPEIICVETDGCDNDDAWMVKLTDCKRDTEDFWRKLGYEVTFKKIKEI